MDNSIVISTPPHVKSSRTTRRIMLDVLIALAPAAICGIVYFLLDAFILEITCVAFAVIAEFVYYFIAKGGLPTRRQRNFQRRLKSLKRRANPLKNLQRHAKKSMQSSGQRHLQSRAGCA